MLRSISRLARSSIARSRFARTLGLGATLAGALLLAAPSAPAQMLIPTVPAAGQTTGTTSGLTLSSVRQLASPAKPGAAGSTMAPAPVLPPETVIMRVNGEAITEDQIGKMVNQLMMRYLSSLPAGAATKIPREEILRKRAELRHDARQRLTSDTLLKQAIQPELDKVTTASIETRIKQMNDVMDKQGFNLEAALAQGNHSLDELRRNIRNELAATALVERQYGPVEPSEDDLLQAFAKNPKRFDQPDKVRLSELVLLFAGNAKVPALGPDAVSPEKKAELKKKAEELLGRIRKGEDFAELARQNSQANDAANGGDLGFREPKRMIKPYQETLGKLKAGEVSDVIETKWGYHIIKLTERRAAQPATFDDAHGMLFEQLRTNKMQERIGQLLADLRPKAKIEDLAPDPPVPPAPALTRPTTATQRGRTLRPSLPVKRVGPVR